MRREFIEDIRFREFNWDTGKCDLENGQKTRREDVGDEGRRM